MSFFGKILVVVQLTLSVLFMMFAAAVYTTHTNWRDKFDTASKAQAKAVNEKNAAQEEASKYQTELKQAMDRSEQRAQEAEAQLNIITQQFETSKQQAANLQAQLATSQRRAQNSADEAMARNEEARELREVNHVQTGLISQAETDKAKLNDEVRKLTSDLEVAGGKNSGLVKQISIYRALLAKNGIEADEAIDIANIVQPPPRIEGKVSTVRKPLKLGNAETLGITLGINDGLQAGHEMTVWRPSGKTGAKPRYLAKIRIVSTNPDTAVGEVIETSRNGAIQEGDHVTTKL